MSNLAVLRIQKLKSWSALGRVHDHNARLQDTVHVREGTHPDTHVSTVRFKRDGTLIRSEEPTPQLVRERMQELGIEPPTGTAGKEGHVLAVEMILSASPAFFQAEAEEWQTGTISNGVSQWFLANAEFLKGRFGPGLVSMSLHLDETTPHIHAVIVPVLQKAEVKRGRPPKDPAKRAQWEADRAAAKLSWRLSARDVFGAERSALSQLQDEYGAAMEPLGLERGQRRSGVRHQAPAVYRQQLAGEVAEARQKLEREWAQLDEDRRGQLDEIQSQKHIAEIQQRNAEAGLHQLATLQRRLTDRVAAWEAEKKVERTQLEAEKAKMAEEAAAARQTLSDAQRELEDHRVSEQRKLQLEKDTWERQRALEHAVLETEKTKAHQEAQAIEAAQQQLQQRQQQLADEQRRLEEERTQLATDRAKAAEETEAGRRSLSETRQQIDREKADWTIQKMAEQANLESEKARIRDEARALAEAKRQLQNDIEEAQAAISADHTSLAAERSQFRGERKAFMESMAQTIQEFDREKTEWGRQRARERGELELEKAQASVKAEAAEEARQRAVEDRKQLEVEKTAWERQKAAESDHLADERTGIARETLELKTQRRQLESEKEAWEREKEADRRRIALDRETASAEKAHGQAMGIAFDAWAAREILDAERGADQRWTFKFRKDIDETRRKKLLEALQPAWNKAAELVATLARVLRQKIKAAITPEIIAQEARKQVTEEMVRKEVHASITPELMEDILRERVKTSREALARMQAEQARRRGGREI